MGSRSLSGRRSGIRGSPASMGASRSSFLREMERSLDSVRSVRRAVTTMLTIVSPRSGRSTSSRSSGGKASARRSGSGFAPAWSRRVAFGDVVGASREPPGARVLCAARVRAGRSRNHRKTQRPEGGSLARIAYRLRRGGRLSGRAVSRSVSGCAASRAVTPSSLSGREPNHGDRSIAG